MLEIWVNSEEELPEIATQLLKQSKGRKIWVFKGPMGVGKTTFIKQICESLGSQDRFSSPTFSLVNEYEDAEGLPIYHFDFYRIEDEQEAYDMGVEEYFESGSFCFVEWPERIASILPSGVFSIEMEDHENKRRMIVD